MTQMKHIIQHRVETPRQYHLPPIMNPPQPPAVTQVSPPHQIIQQVPVPQVTYQNLVPDNQQKSMFNKAGKVCIMIYFYKFIYEMKEVHLILVFKCLFL